MTKKEFNIKNVKVEEVVEHLKEAHQVSFESRASLGVGEFISEHFPNLTLFSKKSIPSIRLGYG